VAIKSAYRIGGSPLWVGSCTPTTNGIPAKRQVAREIFSRPRYRRPMVADEPTRQTEQWSDRLSAAWERYREKLFEGPRPVSDWLVDRLDPQPGQTILELAAGPGETGFLVAERLGPDGRLISTDLGAGMVAAATRGVAARGLENVECRVLDAQAIDLPDDSVDGVLCRFGVMLMPEPARALAGVHRVLRHDGRFAYAVWGAPPDNPWLMAFGGAVLQAGFVPPASPMDPGGPFSLASADANRALCEAAGFTDVVVEEVDGVMAFDSFDDYWELQSQVSGPLALLVSELGPDDVARVQDALRPMLEPFETDDGLAIPLRALGVLAS
jgi:SAM-dependent methyltransferase